MDTLWAQRFAQRTQRMKSSAVRELLKLTERRDTMLAALKAHFPPGVTWTQPQGGLFLWLKFPEHLDAAVVLKAAIEQKVAFVPGESFFADGSGRNTARLNFSNASPERVEEGIARLALCVGRFMP